MNRLAAWFAARLPFARLWRRHLSDYQVPRNLNLLYVFGSLSLLALVIQLVSGLWLAMGYVPTVEQAFASVEAMTRAFDYGWLIRVLHSTGASALFLVVYLHMFRGVLYGSYRRPRELVWLLGMLIYLALILEAFMGYLLPWGQMSYWAAQVVFSLIDAIPLIGDGLAAWIRGDYLISTVTLGRFFALHVIGVPLLIGALVLLHIMALREVGSNNPDGIDPRDLRDAQGNLVDTLPFHPYYTVKDVLGAGLFLAAFFAVVFFWPELSLEPANFAQADPLHTPSHILPPWYLAPFYAMLRAVPGTLPGLCVLLAALLMLFLLPWLDRSPVRSTRYKGRWSRLGLVLWCAAVLLLFWCGTQPLDAPVLWLSRLGTLLYFAWFCLMPLYTRLERSRPLPMGLGS